jgi:hypothetical protein
MIYTKSAISNQRILMLAILLHVVTLSMAQNPEDRLLAYNVDEDSLAVQGYDVVSYFFDRPQAGIRSIAYQYKNIIYQFSTEENKKMFVKDPEKFEPAYGGWCAFAIADSGEKVKIDPKTYKIIDGKLYLFYNFYFNNTLIDWNKNEMNLRKKADENWAKILVNE